MKFGIVQFPGSNCDQDAYHVLADVLGQPTRYIWHKDSVLGDVDCVIIPGGFSYGDYLRTGAIARFSPAMKAVIEHANAGGLVIGICNGFQILCEAHLLPGALIRNRGLKFVCDWVRLRVETADSPFTNACRPCHDNSSTRTACWSDTSRTPTAQSTTSPASATKREMSSA